MSTAASAAGDSPGQFNLRNFPSDATSPRDIFHYLIRDLVADEVVAENQGSTILKQLLHREELGSTNIGRGIALPHIATAAATRAAIVGGQLASAIRWEEETRQPVRFVFLIVTPPGDAAGKQRCLQRVVEFMRDRDDS